MSEILKPPTTFEQQTELLSEKGIIIDDYKQCEKMLSHLNYYRLSGYLLPFINKETEKCYSSVNIETIEAIYNFDADLRILISPVIEKIEIYIRTQLSYYHAHHYGSDGYMTAENFNNKHNHDKFMQLFQNCINDNAKSLVVKHHLKKYGGKFPIWVIIDFFSLGMLSHFYTDLRNCDKSELAKTLYHTNYQTLSSWLRCITDLRNRCAHYSRLYYWRFPAVPKMPRNYTSKPDGTLFSQLLMLKFMYPYPETWVKDFVNPLSKLIKHYNTYISLKHIGFPYNWKSILSES